MNSALSPYEQMGGETGVRALVDRFYDFMDREPSVRALRDLHAGDLSVARDKLTWFLMGWLGGPQAFVERFGHPRLRARHLPFPITVEMRDQWMTCMRTALNGVVHEELRAMVDSKLWALADHMRNQPE